MEGNLLTQLHKYEYTNTMQGNILMQLQEEQKDMRGEVTEGQPE